MDSQTTASTFHEPQTTPSLKSQKKRGKINIVACDRCKRDKKKCDGNYLTQKACKYCHNHNETCVYSEPNFLRISRILNAARKNAVSGEDREDDQEKSIQELEDQITKYENTITSLLSQLENKNESIGNLYLSLFSNPQISNEQTIILKKLCEITNNSNSNIDEENINKIRNRLLILASNNLTEIEKGHIWEELDRFVNDSSFDNVIPFATTNIFGLSYHPSGSTTPIPSPQFIVSDQFQDNVTNEHMTSPKKRNSKRFEPYPSGGRIAIRPSKKETNVMVWHQNDPCEDVPIIAVHAPQDNLDIETELETNIQPSDVQFDNNSLLSPPGFEEVGFDEIDQLSNVTSPNHHSIDIETEFETNIQPSDVQFDNNSLLSPPRLEEVGFDEIDQHSNVTSPTFSNNSISDEDFTYYLFFSDPISLNENY